MSSKVPITSEIAKPHVDRNSVQSLAAFAAATLREQLTKSSKSPSISAETKKGIVKRVSPKAAAEFSVADNVPLLVSLEVETIGERIRLYPFTALYREAINWASKDMVRAWMLHSHSLRQSELYIIQERSTDLLRFIRDVAQDFGLAAPDRSKSFEKAFKKRFGRRLRERHRLVHAHERPSLTSRVIDFGLAAEDTDKDIVADTLADLVIKMVNMLPGDAPKDSEELLQRMNGLRDAYPIFAHQEAADMFDMLAIELGTTLGVPFIIPAQSSSDKTAPSA